MAALAKDLVPFCTSFWTLHRRAENHLRAGTVSDRRRWYLRHPSHWQQAIARQDVFHGRWRSASPSCGSGKFRGRDCAPTTCFATSPGPRRENTVQHCGTRPAIPTDLLGIDVELPQPEIGDFIAVLKSGSYGFTASPLLFLGRQTPAELICQDGKVGLARASRTIVDFN